MCSAFNVSGNRKCPCTQKFRVVAGKGHGFVSEKNHAATGVRVAICASGP